MAKWTKELLDENVANASASARLLLWELGQKPNAPMSDLKAGPVSYAILQRIARSRNLEPLVLVDDSTGEKRYRLNPEYARMIKAVVPDKPRGGAVKRGGGRRRAAASPAAAGEPPVRRGPGRPRKNPLPMPAPLAFPGVRRGPGRPRKSDLDSIALPMTGGLSLGFWQQLIAFVNASRRVVLELDEQTVRLKRA
ncbi:MAG: hypothetical protein U1E76_22215 [Planctomycetota bacterium]